MYAIEYEHLKDDLIKDHMTRYNFNQVKEVANKYSLELSDEEFNGFFKLQRDGKDIVWIMHKMRVYNLSFTDALITYITD